MLRPGSLGALFLFFLRNERKRREGKRNEMRRDACSVLRKVLKLSEIFEGTLNIFRCFCFLFPKERKVLKLGEIFEGTLS
jgi:hypothetical protein